MHLRAELLRLRVARARRAPGPRCRSESRGSSRSSSSSRPVRPARSSRAPGRPALPTRVHGRREPRGSGADDDHVAQLRLVDGVVEAEAVGDLLIGRIPQHRLAAADQDRHIRAR